MKKIIAYSRRLVWRAGKEDSHTLRCLGFNAAAFRSSLFALTFFGVMGGMSVAQAQQPDPLTITKDGNVGIGTTGPAAKLEIDGKIFLQNADGRNYFKDGEKNDGKGLRVGALWSQYGIYAETGMGAVGGADGVTLQNGALTVDGAGNTTISGNATAASFNGDKPPYVFEIGNKADTNNWHAVQVPSDIIKRYLGDANGGTIRINLRVNDSDEVRTITETIYIEQPDKSNNRNPGLNGHSRQEGGGETSFVLDTSNRTDVIPHPWDWIWVRNYASPEPPGRGGNTGAAWTGDHKYRLEFMTRPNVSATVIIYDR